MILLLALIPGKPAIALRSSDAAGSWEVREETTQQGGNELRIFHSSKQYAALHQRDSYLRMVYSPEAEWGTSLILLPSYWSQGYLYQGAPVTVTWDVVSSDLVLYITGTIGALDVSSQVTMSAPSDSDFLAEVSVSVITGSVSLDNQPDEAFKPVMLSSMHISTENWDAESAVIGDRRITLPDKGWIVNPALSGTKFGLLGGTSRWKTNAPTLRIDLDRELPITGWVTLSHDPGDDNVGIWAASDRVLPHWNYQITVSERRWEEFLPIVSRHPTLTPTPIPTPTPTPTPTRWQSVRQAENPSAYTVGKTINRANACALAVHGQFGTKDVNPYPPQSGHVEYHAITIPQTDNVFLKVRYSKYSAGSVPIQVLVDGVQRAEFTPVDQGGWNYFACTEAIGLGNITSGTHTLTFFTAGQQFGVADLDKFFLSNEVNPWPTCTCD